ncbi:MAG TPA: hypothetical protein EYO59_11930 [Chromatiaceae bacterium]|nr:hypothetical protein [Chromatiaceae bacterium]
MQPTSRHSQTPSPSTAKAKKPPQTQPPTLNSPNLIPTELLGSWRDNYCSVHSLSQRGRWRQIGGFNFQVLSRHQMQEQGKGVTRLVAQNEAKNPIHPERFSAFDFLPTKKPNQWYYCQTVFNALTKSGALSHPSADPTNPSEGGCGDFPWTLLSRKKPR